MNVNKMSGGAGGGDLGDPTIGAHYSRLVGFCYIGVHDRAAFGGEAKKPCGKVLFTFELLDDFVEIDGVTRPRWITKKENAFSTSNANAVKIYNTLDPTNVHGGAFDQLAIATTPCMVTIGPRKDKNDVIIDGVRIDSIQPVAKDPQGNEYQLNLAANPVIVFDFDEPTLESYATLKPWMMKLCKAANDYSGSACERIAVQYDAQQAAAEGAGSAPAAGQAATAPPAQPPAATTAPLAPPPAQTAQTAQTAPVQQTAPAPAQAPAPAPVVQTAPLPAAPPGFRYDAATNSFVPEDTPVVQQAAGQALPPAGGGAY
jgi:hypothetical protein